MMLYKFLFVFVPADFFPITLLSWKTFANSQVQRREEAWQFLCVLLKKDVKREKLATVTKLQEKPYALYF